MSTYKKPLKGIEITSIMDNNSSCEDEGINRYGSNAIADFERKDTVKITDDYGEMYIPFHAVKKVAITTTAEDIEKGNSYGCEAGGGGGEPEVWLVGDTYADEDGYRMFTLSNADATDHMSELFANANNYNVYLGETELPYVFTSEEYAIFGDTNDPDAMNKTVSIYPDGQGYIADATWSPIADAPTSVEVSVKAK